MRKLWLKYEKALGSWSAWTWSKEAILHVGPDAAEHMGALPDLRKVKLLAMFKPLPPTRWSMWACLMGIAFKQLPEAAKAFSEGRVPVEMFREHAERLREARGGNPHVKFVWESILRTLPAAA